MPPQKKTTPASIKEAPPIKSNKEEPQPVDVPADKDHVKKWEENPEHNLGKLHPDFVPSNNTTEKAEVVATVASTIYADEDENDDKGLVSTGDVKGDKGNDDEDQEYNGVEVE